MNGYPLKHETQRCSPPKNRVFRSKKLVFRYQKKGLLMVKRVPQVLPALKSGVFNLVVPLDLKGPGIGLF